MGEGGLDAAPSTDRSSSSGNIPSDSDITAKRECTNGVVAVEDDDEFRKVSTNLETPAQTGCSNTRWSGPGAIRETGDDET